MAGPEEEKGSAPGSGDEDLFVSCSGQMTLEAIVDSTGEFKHLNELVRLTIERCGGFKDTDAYFRTVTPLLDLLEVEIRVRYVPGMTRNQMKLVIQDWIDAEMAGLQ